VGRGTAGWTCKAWRTRKGGGQVPSVRRLRYRPRRCRRRSRISCQMAIATMAGEKSAIAIVPSKARITSLSVSLTNPPFLKQTYPFVGIL
jgi:hypothetical protein